MIGEMIGAISGLGGLVSNVLDRFWPPQMEEKDKAALQTALTIQLEEFVARREAAQRDVMVEELRQGDPYTKRARPTIVYAGLAFIFLVHVALPVAGWLSVILRDRPLPEAPPLSLPAEFWWAWTGVCGVYAIGRTLEKRGLTDPVDAVGRALGSKK